MTGRRALRLALWLLAGALVWWVLRGTPLAQVWQTLRGLTAGQLLALAGANGLILLAFGGRWWAILRAQSHRLPYLRLCQYRLAAFAVSYFTPGPQFGGEPLQIYLLRQRQAVPGSIATAAVILDKTLELLANFSVLALGAAAVLHLGLGPVGGEMIMAGLAGALLSLPLIYLTAVWRGARPLSRVLGRIGGRDRSLRLRYLLNYVAASEGEVVTFCRRQPRGLVLAIGFSTLAWAMMLAEYWLMARFLGLYLSPLEALAALTAARFAFLLPLPGGLGVLEASQVYAMGMLGYDPAAGLALALLIRGRDVLIALSGVALARVSLNRSL